MQSDRLPNAQYVEFMPRESQYLRILSFSLEKGIGSESCPTWGIPSFVDGWIVALYWTDLILTVGRFFVRQALGAGHLPTYAGYTIGMASSGAL
jgi:hypothetical protein